MFADVLKAAKAVSGARNGQTSRHAVRTSEELVENEKGRITGVLRNDLDFDDYAQSYYYSYSCGYGQYSEGKPMMRR